MELILEFHSTCLINLLIVCNDNFVLRDYETVCFWGDLYPREEHSLMQKIKFKNFCLDSRAVDAICLDQYYLLDDIHDQLLAYLTTL